MTLSMVALPCVALPEHGEETLLLLPLPPHHLQHTTITVLVVGSALLLHPTLTPGTPSTLVLLVGQIFSGSTTGVVRVTHTPTTRLKGLLFLLKSPTLPLLPMRISLGVSEMSEDSELRRCQQQQEARQKARDEAENDMKKAWNPEKKGDTDPSL